MFTNSVAATLAFALLSSVDAHMVMSSPQPYNFASLSNGPISSGTFAFPCHVGGGYTLDDASAQATQAKAGSTIPVSFTGSAVHGGGTCQFSVSYEETPSADPSTWKVIHTIEGGCPAEAEGNLPEGGGDGKGHAAGKQCADSEKSTGTECVRSFDIPIPEGMKNGKAVFAWTWFNRLGNREMYMNCAPIEITGGKDDDSALGDLPPIFVANYGAEPGSCVTGQGVLPIPEANVGKSLVSNIKSGITALTLGDAGTCKATTGNGGGDTTTPAPAESSVVNSPTPTKTPEANQGGVFAPGATSETAPTPTAITAPAPSTNPDPAPAPAPAPGNSSGVACQTNGAIVCMDNNMWGLCNNGFAIPQALAAGTECKGTAIQALAKNKRHLNRHLRMHPRSFR